MLNLVILCALSAQGDFDLGDFVPSHEFPGVLIADGAEFGGGKEEVRANWKATISHICHFDGYIHTFYTEKSYYLWRECADWSRNCWDQLDNFHQAKAVHPFMNQIEAQDNRRRKLQALHRLKEFMGDDAYALRLMPPTSVTWLK